MKLLALLVALASSAAAQIQVDPAIAAEIAKIKAIDNHGHPVLPTPGDTGYDALPVEHMDPYTEPIRTQAGSPAAAEASTHGFGTESIRQRGQDYPNWVLDQLGIETMLANRVTMGPGIAPPRFLWVPFDDALLFPLDNRALATNSDRKSFFEDEDRLLKIYLKDSGYAKPPASLGEYLQKIVDPTLARQKRGGAVAIKFEAAYLRSLDFEDVPRDVAQGIYRSGRGTWNSEYKKLQDFLFRYIAAKAGWAWRYICTWPGERAATSTSQGRILYCSNRYSTIRACAEPISSCCTAAGRLLARSRRCCRNPTCTPISPRKHW